MFLLKLPTIQIFVPITLSHEFFVEIGNVNSIASAH